MYIVFRHAGPGGHQKNRRRLRICAGRAETVVQYHPGHVLHGNGEFIGGDEGQGGRTGRSDWLLSSQHSHRHRDIRDSGDLPAGHEVDTEIQGDGRIAQGELGLAERTGKLLATSISNRMS